MSVTLPRSGKSQDGAQNLLKKDKERPALSADHSNSQVRLKPTQDKGLKGSFILAAVGQDDTISVTVHHPIGVTNLGSDEWVITDTSGIYHLSRRAAQNKGPSDEHKSLILEKVREALISAKKLKKLPDGGLTYYSHEGGLSRDVLLKDAQGAFKEARKAHNKAFHEAREAYLRRKREAFELANPGRKYTPPKIVTEKDVGIAPENLKLEDFIKDDVLKSLEQDLEKSRKEILKGVEKDNPYHYPETKGGPMNDQPQVPVPTLRGKGTREAMDWMIQNIVSLSAMSASDIQRINALQSSHRYDVRYAGGGSSYPTGSGASPERRERSRKTFPE